MSGQEGAVKKKRKLHVSHGIAPSMPTAASKGSKCVIKGSARPKLQQILLPKVAHGLNDEEITKIIMSKEFNHCCSGQNPCYVRSLCSVEVGRDMNSLIKYVRDCREVTRTKSAEERSQFLIQAFKQAIAGEVWETDKVQRRWLDHFENDVCTTAWRNLYNYSKYVVDKCANLVLDNPNMDVCGSCRPYTDDTLHGNTFNEAFTIFADCIPDFNFSKYAYAISTLCVISDTLYLINTYTCINS